MKPHNSAFKSPRLLNFEMVDMVAWRDVVHAHEAWSLVPLRQDQVSDDLPALDPDGGKGHAHLERNPGLLRQDGHRPAPPHLGYELVVE